MSNDDPPYFEIRASPTHGSGAFALRPIPRRTRLIEYTGERISHKEANSRPDVDDGTGSIHVLLFTVDSRTVIDARVDGNDARFFNHSCAGNCEAVIERRRIFLETTRDIAAGEELTYDYEMEYNGESLEVARSTYPCRCGTPNCRGTLLDVPARLLRKPKAAPRKKVKGSRKATRLSRTAPSRKKRASRPDRKGKKSVARTGSKPTAAARRGK